MDNKTARAIVGRNIDRALHRLNISVIELADRAGMTRQYVYDIIDGDANFTIEAVEKIALALGMDARELFLMQPDFPEQVGAC